MEFTHTEITEFLAAEIVRHMRWTRTPDGMTELMTLAAEWGYRRSDAQRAIFSLRDFGLVRFRIDPFRPGRMRVYLTEKGLSQPLVDSQNM